LVKRAQNVGYTVVLIFLWLDSVELAKARVRLRVSSGGHNIPSEIIERRYRRGVKNFSEIFIKLVDKWYLFDNSKGESVEIAEGNQNGIKFVYNDDIWNSMKFDGNNSD